MDYRETNGNVIPHLSTSGWMGNPDSIVKKLYEYFLTSEYSQTNTYLGYISSITYLVQKYDNHDELKSEIKTTLSTMYKRFFSDVIIDVTYEDTINSITIFLIDIEVIDYLNNRYSLSSSIRESNGSVVDIEETIARLHSY